MISPTRKIRNGIEMPYLILGVPMIAEAANIMEKAFCKTIVDAVGLGISGFDTSSSYGKSEKLLGEMLSKIKQNKKNYSPLFVTTKIGNGQQIRGNIEKYIDKALQKLKIDKIDAMLLHWPYPDYYIHNWEKLITIYKSGKVRSIGIANAKIRHLEAIRKEGLMMPHILQTEIHPLNTCTDLRQYCHNHNIALQACTSLCSMTPLIRESKSLLQIASNHQKTLPQIVLRWHIQNGISPIFRSFNSKHLAEMANVWNFELTNEEMDRISAENINYRYHPESPNCPGF